MAKDSLPIANNDTSISSYTARNTSFSGADIKVIVHFPNRYEDILALEKKKNSLSQERSKIDNNSVTPEEYRKSIAEAEFLDSSILEIDTKLSKLSGPTSEVLGSLQTISWSMFRDKGPVRSLGSVYPRSYVRGHRTISGSMVFTVFHKHALHKLMEFSMYNTGTSDRDNYTYTTILSDQLPPLDISLIFANEYGVISYMGIYGVEFFQEGGTFSIEDIYSETVLQYVARDIDPIRNIEERNIDSHGVTEYWGSSASSLHKEDQLVNYRRNPFI